jgi:hypothetical protein
MGSKLERKVSDDRNTLTKPVNTCQLLHQIAYSNIVDATQEGTHQESVLDRGGFILALFTKGPLSPLRPVKPRFLSESDLGHWPVPRGLWKHRDISSSAWDWKWKMKV